MAVGRGVFFSPPWRFLETPWRSSETAVQDGRHPARSSTGRTAEVLKVKGIIGNTHTLHPAQG